MAERTETPRFRAAFIPLAALLLFALLEAAGHAAFWLKHRSLPYPFATAHFYQTVSLLMPDHPYLPYLATKGVANGVEYNRWGDRGPELDEPKRRVRVLCYGGSTTNDGLWPGHLRRLLGEDRYEVVIAAQSGATTADTLVNFALIHQDFKPDFVLALEGINDLESSYMPGFRPDYAHRRRKIGGTPYPFFDRLPRALNYSSVYVLARWKLVGPRGDLHAQFSRPGKYDFVNGPFGLSTYERNLRSLNLLAKAAGARLVLGTAPYNHEAAARFAGREFADGWRKGVDAENAIVRRLGASGDGIMVAEAARRVPADDEHFVDFCHFRDAGAKLTAQAFYDALRASSSFQRVNSDSTR